jgi:hypothetical protein
MLISSLSLHAFNLNFIFQRALAEIDSGKVQRHGRQTLQIALRRPFQHRAAFLSSANSTENGMKVVFACNSVSLLLILTPHQQISTGEKEQWILASYMCRRKDKDLLALLAWIMQTLLI